MRNERRTDTSIICITENMMTAGEKLTSKGVRFIYLWITNRSLFSAHGHNAASIGYPKRRRGSDATEMVAIVVLSICQSVGPWDPVYIIREFAGGCARHQRIPFPPTNFGRILYAENSVRQRKRMHSTRADSMPRSPIDALPSPQLCQLTELGPDRRREN